MEAQRVAGALGEGPTIGLSLYRKNAMTVGETKGQEGERFQEDFQNGSGVVTRITRQTASLL